MDGLGRTPARTEADICAALAELGRQAPSADGVLSELREARSRRQRRSPRLPGQPLPTGPGRALIPRLGWPQLAVGTAAAVTATAVTLALTLGSSPSRTGGPDVFPALPNSPASADGPPAVVSPGHDPTSASLARAMLTAFNATADDLAYETLAYFTAGHLTQTDRTWSWPAVPSPGQLQYARDAYSAIPQGASEATAPVKPTEDDGYTTVVPRPSIYLQRSRPASSSSAMPRPASGPAAARAASTPRGEPGHSTPQSCHTSTTPPHPAEPISHGRSPVGNDASSATPGCAGSGPSS